MRKRALFLCCRLAIREELFTLVLGLVLLALPVSAQTPPAPAATPVPDPHQELEALLTELSTAPAQAVGSPATAAPAAPAPAPVTTVTSPEDRALGESVLFEFYGPQALEYAARRLPGLGAEGSPGLDLAAEARPGRAVHHPDGTFSLIFRTPGDSPLELSITHDAEGRPLRTGWTRVAGDETSVTDLFGKVPGILSALYAGLEPGELVMDAGTSRLFLAPDGEPEFHVTFVYADARRPFGFRVRVDRHGEVLGHDRIFAPRVIQDLRDTLGQVLEADGILEVGAEPPVPASDSLRLQAGGAVVGVYRWPSGPQARGVALIWREGQVQTRPLAARAGAAPGWASLAR